MNIKNILLSVLSIVMCVFISGYIPMLSIVIVIIPAVLMILSKKGSFKEVILAILLSAIIIYFIFGFLNMMFIVIFAVLNLIVLLYSYGEKISAIVTQIFLSLSILISFTIIIYIFNAIEGVSITDLFIESLRNSENALTTNNVLAGSDFTVTDIMNQIVLIVPFIMVLLSSMNAIVMYFFTRYLLVKMNYKVIVIDKFSNFRLPMHFMYGITFILLLSYIVGSMDVVNFNSISLNVILMMVHIFAFQGIAILFYFLDIRNINKVLKGVILSLVIIFQGLFILSIVGWIDMLFN
ncbi:MAG: DUF2232 domain-containing protein, partial [Bacillota bacterium]|nr:DUF2232 domain-containing protein [Bacillota bacterium]